MLDSTIKSKIDQLWNKFWSGGISNPIDSIEQMSYLIFMKRLEDQDIQRMNESKLKSKPFISIFKGHEDCKWSVWKQYPADKILNHVRDKVFSFLRDLGEKDSLYRKYMEHSNFIIPTPALLIESVNIIDEIHLSEHEDTLGDLYEYLLSELQTSGKNGQFRTPRHIIKMMTELVDPKFGDKICDPSCGTAGFLVSAYEHILKSNTSKNIIKIDDEGNEYNFKGDKLTTQDHQRLKSDTLFGYDNDIRMVKISLMNLMMHGITSPNINRINTLSNRFNENNTYNIILANPPFKGSIDESEMSEDFTIKSKKTELLFLELMYNILRIDGKCAVIVPDGVLFGSSNAHKQVKQMLLEKCRIDAIISMPSGVFKPYAGVSTAVIVFKKGEPTKEIFYYDMQSDGYTLDDKRTPIDKKGDIPDIISKFKNKTKEKLDDRTKKCFIVPIKEIIDNDYDLSINKYKKIIYEEVKYEKPAVIKKSIIDTEKEIIKILDELAV